MALTPVDPTPGQTATLYLDYTVPEGLTIMDGTAEYDVTYNYIPFSPTTEPLCQDIPCPLGPGRYQNTSDSEWPTGVSGFLDTKMKWLDTNKNLLLCVEISAQIAGAAAVTPPSKALVFVK
jgi:hypothetical protein